MTYMYDEKTAVDRNSVKHNLYNTEKLLMILSLLLN